MKDAGALGWVEVGHHEAALIERCAAGEPTACAELVSVTRMGSSLRCTCLAKFGRSPRLPGVFSTSPTITNPRPLGFQTGVLRICSTRAQSPAWLSASKATVERSARRAHGDLRQRVTTPPSDRALCAQADRERCGPRGPPAVRPAHRIVLRETTAALRGNRFSHRRAIGTVKSRLTGARQTSVMTCGR